MRIRRVFSLASTLVMMACFPNYWPDSNLNNMRLSITKDEFISYWGDGKKCTNLIWGACAGPVLRAARMSSGNVLTEVLTLQFTSSGSNEGVEHWFVFQNGRLVQWGKPQDWQAVAARYEVSFTPSVRP